MRAVPKWVLYPLFASMIFLTHAVARAADKKNAPAEPAAAAASTPADSGAAERVNVDTIKEKYWARGEESELGVVQNRLYSKANKIGFGVFGGITATDPFLSVKTAGASLGYHFSEYFALQANYWKDFVDPSTALLTFQDTLGATTNNNKPTYYVGGEGSASFLYGKLSLVGKKILYYDMHFLFGAGATGTESGSNFTPHAGIGQQVYITKFMSIRVDYRLMTYKETIVEKVITPKLGQVVGERRNWSNAITVGFDFIFGPGAKVQQEDSQ